MDINGILNIDKPKGITSAAVVRRLKYASKATKVGHGGTLDPLATGVLPVCFGQGTRVSQYLLDSQKEYKAVIRFGVETDTYDSTGDVVRTQDPPELSQADLAKIVEKFKGEFDQLPPAYSALKFKGIPFYQLARLGADVPRKPRKVVVYEINVTCWESPLLTVTITCGSGFYVRSLAHDIGQILGSGAHLEDLIRLRSGPFRIQQSLELNCAEEKIVSGDLQLEPIDIVLNSMDVLILGKNEESDIVNGREISIDEYVSPAGEVRRCRAYSEDGKFLAIVGSQNGTSQWRPIKVFK